MTALWVWLLVASSAVWATKVAGLAVPGGWLERPRVRRLATLLPVTMLAAIAALAVVDGGGAWRLDPALVVGTAAGVALAASRRAGLFGAFVAAAAVTAAVRVLGG